MNKLKEILAITCITIVASIWWYRAIKGSTIYESIHELVYVLIIALIISSIISFVYFKIKKKK